MIEDHDRVTHAHKHNPTYSAIALRYFISRHASGRESAQVSYTGVTATTPASTATTTDVLGQQRTYAMKLPTTSTLDLYAADRAHVATMTEANVTTSSAPFGALPPSHIRLFRTNGNTELRANAAAAFDLQRVVRDTYPGAAKLRYQKGWNRFVSPWIVAIADPRASVSYGGGTGESVGCFACVRPLYTQNPSGLGIKYFELYTLDRGTIVVREGKGKRDRIVPIGDRAIAWIQKYLADVRPWFASDPDDGKVFLTHRGQAISRNQLTTMVHHYVEQAQIGKRGACHLFRHAMATLMLENGADIRYIQQMLGHRSLETTEIYTHVSIRKLKEIHSATHPAARLAHRGDDQHDEAPLPAVDHVATGVHVDQEIERAAAKEVEHRYHRAARSRGLKILRTLARQKEVEDHRP